MNICEKCGTGNEEKYKYCKNCGDFLNVQPDSAEPIHQFEQEQQTTATENSFNEEKTTENANQNNTYSQNSAYYNQSIGYFSVEDFGGVSAEEMSFFIGKKADKFLPKFSKMELTASKTTWCWPAAILGYLFGPLGSAFWFFYRKMYKTAVIFSIIGAAVIILTSALGFNTSGNIMESIADVTDFEGLISAVQESVNSSEITTGDVLRSTVSSAISSLADIAACVVAGMYGMYFYKNHCKKRIIQYRSLIADQRYYKIGLASIGGTSVGFVILGIALYFAASEIGSIAAMLLSSIFR